MTEISSLPSAPANADALIALAYDELRRIARSLRQQKGQGLNTTTLVHEAYLKLREHSGLQGGEHLKSLAARAMRQILIDHLRRRQAQKRSVEFASLSLDDVLIPEVASSFDLIALDQALHTVEAVDQRLARIVEMYVFAGMTMPEIAGVVGVTERTVFRDWRKARALLTDLLDLPMPAGLQ